MPATAALPSQEEKAQQWNIVMGLDEVAAIWTPRAWSDDILAPRDSMDADIGKASDDESHQETGCDPKRTTHGVPY